MILYLMRHGIAQDHSVWSGSDDDRPLTPEGRDRARSVLNKLKKNGELAVDAIWSSPLVRARQTAEIAADVLGLEVKLVEALECGATAAALMRCFKNIPPPGRLLTVGHEPDCGVILDDLSGGDGRPFKRAGIARLEGDFKPGGMKLIWHYAPHDVLGD